MEQDIKARFMHSFVKELMRQAAAYKRDTSVHPLPGTGSKEDNIKEITENVPVIGKQVKPSHLQEAKPLVPRIPDDPQPRPQENIEKPLEPKPPALSLGKVSEFISDPNVRTVECPGPGKYVLVEVRGKTRATKTVLTKDEIKKVIEDFSDKTRIPLIGGTFKAAYHGLIMTAVISDFIGSRFVIQKKKPSYDVPR